MWHTEWMSKKPIRLIVERGDISFVKNLCIIHIQFYKTECAEAICRQYVSQLLKLLMEFTLIVFVLGLLSIMDEDTMSGIYHNT